MKTLKEVAKEAADQDRMILTEDQKKEMQRLFPNGWEESDIPAIWRKEYKEAIEEGIRTDASADEGPRCPECEEPVDEEGEICPECDEKYQETYSEKNRVK